MAPNNPSAHTRRDLLKKGAVAGAVAWSVPIVISSPAFAATGECSGSRPCSAYYFIKIQPGGITGGTADGKGTGCNDSLPPNPFGCPGQPTPTVQSGGNNLGITGTFNSPTATLTLPAGIVPLYAQPKPRNNCFSYKYNQGTNSFSPLGSAPAGAVTVQSGNPAVGMTIVYNIASLSHANLYFCK